MIYCLTIMVSRSFLFIYHKTMYPTITNQVFLDLPVPKSTFEHISTFGFWSYLHHPLCCATTQLSVVASIKLQTGAHTLFLFQPVRAEHNACCETRFAHFLWKTRATHCVFHNSAHKFCHGAPRVMKTCLKWQVFNSGVLFSVMETTKTTRHVR